MHTSELVYVIPPYLLNTALGASLQKNLADLDPKLSQLNYISTNSKYYNADKSPLQGESENTSASSSSPLSASAQRRFSDDPILNQIIKDKLAFKLATIGVIGDNSPMYMLEEDEEYLFEIYDIFKSRLIYGGVRETPRLSKFLEGNGRYARSRSHATGAGSDNGVGMAPRAGGGTNEDPSNSIYSFIDMLLQVDDESQAGQLDDRSDVEDSNDIDENLDDDFVDADEDNGFDSYQYADYEGNDSVDQDTIDQETPLTGTKHTARNIFNSEKIGEFKVENITNYVNEVMMEIAASVPQIPSRYRVCRYSLRQYKQFMCSSTQRLLLKATTEESRYKSLPSFVEVNNEFFQYPLPLNWVPLASSKSINYYKKKLGLDIKIEDGFSNINFTQSATYSGKEDTTYSSARSKDKYTNFITDKAVPPSTGIFYYEVEIRQKCTSASNYKPIIVTNEEAVSSNNAMHVCLGFTKRYTSFDQRARSTSTTNASLSGKEIDLEIIRNDVDAFLHSNSPATAERMARYDANLELESGETEAKQNLLSAQPGIFKGSYAVNFEDSVFYNSEKASESLQRTAALNMNRRLSLNRQHIEDQDTGKMDLGFTLLTYLDKNKKETSQNSDNENSKSGSAEDGSNVELDDCDVYNTEIIGCGINFFDKTIFYTSNGILVKVISKEELSSSNPLNEGIFINSEADLFRLAAKAKFEKDRNNQTSISDLKSVFPMIGIKLNPDLTSSKGENHSSTTSSTTIITNLGFKEFRYNINNHIRGFRTEIQNSLYQSLLNKIELNRLDEKTRSNPENSHDESSSKSKVTLEKSLLNIDGDSNLINQIIKGYLNHQGYLKTFNAFGNDLKNLEKEVNETSRDDEEIASIDDNDNLALERTHAANRRTILNFILNSEFDQAINFMALKYPALLRGPDPESNKGKKHENPYSLLLELKLFKYISMIKSYLELERVNDSYTANSNAPTIVQSENFAKVFQYGKRLQEEFPKDEVRIQMFSSLFLVKDYPSLNSLPKAGVFITKYDEKLESFADLMNKTILNHLGFKIKSNLEKIVENVDRNIEKLSVKYCDDKFMFVNFERDYLDM